MNKFTLLIFLPFIINFSEATTLKSCNDDRMSKIKYFSILTGDKNEARYDKEIYEWVIVYFRFTPKEPFSLNKHHIQFRGINIKTNSKAELKDFKYDLKDENETLLFKYDENALLMPNKTYTYNALFGLNFENNTEFQFELVNASKMVLACIETNTRNWEKFDDLIATRIRTKRGLMNTTFEILKTPLRWLGIIGSTPINGSADASDKSTTTLDPAAEPNLVITTSTSTSRSYPYPNSDPENNEKNNDLDTDSNYFNNGPNGIQVGIVSSGDDYDIENNSDDKTEDSITIDAKIVIKKDSMLKAFQKICSVLDIALPFNEKTMLHLD